MFKQMLLIIKSNLTCKSTVCVIKVFVAFTVGFRGFVDSPVCRSEREVP